MGSLKKGTTGAYVSVEVPFNGISPEQTVDLRSDTVTKPSSGMRQAMATAVVGDDVFQEDPTVNELESRVATTLGKAAGLFVSSGTMGNLLAAMVHCNERGSEMIVGDQSHMFYYEQGNAAWVGGIQSCQIPNNKDGTFDIQGVVERIRENDIHCPVTKLIAVENTHNRCGGRVMPIKWLDELGACAKENGIALHMDGARVFNASIALGQPVSRIVQDFDSISVCFSKGLATPAGTVLVGSVEFIERARRMRKAIGGAMRQVGVLAAAGIYSLDNMIDRLKDDHDNAKLIAKAINKLASPHVFVNCEELETNIMMVNVSNLDITEFCKRLATVEEKERDEVGGLVSVKCTPWSGTTTRLVTHADVSHEMAKMAAAKICYVIKEFSDISNI